VSNCDVSNCIATHVASRCWLRLVLGKIWFVFAELLPLGLSLLQFFTLYTVLLSFGRQLSLELTTELDYNYN